MAAPILTLSSVILLAFGFVFLSAKRVPSKDVIDSTENADRDHQWEAWKFWHSKTYQSISEEAYRRKIWENKMAAIFTHNAAGGSFKMAMNSFGDQEWTYQPDKQSYRSNRVDVDSDKRFNTVAMETAQPPPSLDWRQKGMVTPVKDQGMLGQVMAFALTESLESYHAIKTGNLVQLSAQEVADCCYVLEYPSGFDCIVNITKGLCSAVDYPTQPVGQCNAHLCSAAATCQNTVHVLPNHENDMVYAVAMTPTVVIVDASLTSFQMYKSGIYDDPQCSITRPDHALVVVGYSTSAGKDYWICRNSWGTAWGEAGYIRIVQGKNMCGIAARAFYPA